jgi:predicted lipoprotein with Yx(FWY)xxD motif
MKRSLIAGAVAVVTFVAVLVLATSFGGEGGASGSTSSAAPSSNSDATVTARQIGDRGSVLVDSSGQALYSADEEAGGMVLCTDECNSFWTPLTVGSGTPSGSSIPGELGVVTRPDGARQVTYDGKLLYSFSLDSAGEVTGDGFSDAFGGQQLTWHVVHSDRTSGSSGGGSTGSGIPGY